MTLVEELAGPGGRTIFPELLKGFLQKVGADVLNFIDADSVDLAERSVFQTPGDDMFDASKTLSQEVRKASTVSFHDIRLAQRARKSM